MARPALSLAFVRDSFIRLPPWDCRKAAAMPEPRVPSFERRGFKWVRYPHAADVLRARQEMAWGEGVRGW